MKLKFTSGVSGKNGSYLGIETNRNPRVGKPGSHFQRKQTRQKKGEKKIGYPWASGTYNDISHR